MVHLQEGGNAGRVMSPNHPPSDPPSHPPTRGHRPQGWALPRTHLIVPVVHSQEGGDVALVRHAAAVWKLAGVGPHHVRRQGHLQDRNPGVVQGVGGGAVRGVEGRAAVWIVVLVPTTCAKRGTWGGTRGRARGASGLLLGSMGINACVVIFQLACKPGVL